MPAARSVKSSPDSAAAKPPIVSLAFRRSSELLGEETIAYDFRLRVLGEGTRYYRIKEIGMSGQWTHFHSRRFPRVKGRDE